MKKGTVRMHYFMGLYDKPFELVKAGEKNVEVRLNDLKRKKLKIGDLITFNKLTNPFEAVTVRITNLSYYPTFKEMLQDFPAHALGSKNATLEEMLEQMHVIYPLEKEQAWGTLAISMEIDKEV